MRTIYSTTLCQATTTCFDSSSSIQHILFFVELVFMTKSFVQLGTTDLICKFTLEQKNVQQKWYLLISESQLVSLHSYVQLFSSWDFLSSLGRPKTCQARVSKLANTKRIKQEPCRRHNNKFLHVQLKQNLIDQRFGDLVIWANPDGSSPGPPL